MRIAHVLTRLCLLLLIAAPAALPLPAMADPVVRGEEHCVINTRSDDRLNVRDGPSVDYDVIGRWRNAKCGIFVYERCRGSWCPVDDGHIMGWAHRRYLGAVSPSMYCVTGIRRGDVLNLRAYPSTSSRILVGLDRHQCDIAFLPFAVGNWQKIRVDGWEGWASRRYLSGE